MNASQEFKVNGVQYRLQYRKCGKATCKCADGQGHGPYWYSYDGQSAAKYVGAKLPESVAKYAALLKSTQPKIKKIRQEIEKQSADAYRKYVRAQSQLRSLRALEECEHVESTVLVELGLSQLVVKH